MWKSLSRRSYGESVGRPKFDFRTGADEEEQRHEISLIQGHKRLHAEPEGARAAAALDDKVPAPLAAGPEGARAVVEDHQGRQEDFQVVEEGEARRGHGRGLGWRAAAELGARRFLGVERVGRCIVVFDVYVLGAAAIIDLFLPVGKRDGHSHYQQHR